MGQPESVTLQKSCILCSYSTAGLWYKKMNKSDSTPLNCSNVWTWLSTWCMKLHVVTWHYSIEILIVCTRLYTIISSIWISSVKTTLCNPLLLTWNHDPVFTCDQPVVWMIKSGLNMYNIPDPMNAMFPQQNRTKENLQSWACMMNDNSLFVNGTTDNLSCIYLVKFWNSWKCFYVVMYFDHISVTVLSALV